ncbi:MULTISPECIES: acyl-CoA dehydrogenase family protein [unclassified Azospirillum]|uniref:acyl-CoA dehydrogenase family protein n=1 Tax=unclassified Azospirillum TaxID=2630922 RepID=UPI000B65DD1B|nr:MULTISPECIES: acyl-CoA dehydrogenase family protein [unclassified Azospirillum]SNT07973.1 Acyl-CoA dehydrogenase [Azospirillum sp. RU38E]SNT22672.1 Acyl-CoA dehydrogenase [Azospirillum sp. RU37A]
MNFLLSDEQVMVTDTLRSLLRDACDPRQVHDIIDRHDGFDAELWQRLVDLGVPGLMLPAEMGGAGLEMIDLALVAELLGEFAAPVPFLGHVLCGLGIRLCGTPDQQARWLPALVSGSILGTVALGEGEECWLPDEWQVTAGDRLSGGKRLVPNAMAADLMLVGTRQGLALVEKGNWTARRREGVDRTRSLEDVTFHEASVALLDRVPEGVTRLIDAAAILLAADAFGGASRCVALATDYAKLREQFGQPIGSFQGLKHQLANMALSVEPGRGLYWYAAHTWDALPGKAGHAAAQAKAHLCDAYLQAARDMVEAFGGIGFTWEHDAHIYLKRAMFDWAWLGSPVRHRLRAAQLAGW